MAVELEECEVKIEFEFLGSQCLIFNISENLQTDIGCFIVDGSVLHCTSETVTRFSYVGQHSQQQAWYKSCCL